MPFVAFDAASYGVINHGPEVNVGNNDSYSVGIRLRSPGRNGQSVTEKWWGGVGTINKYPWAIRGPGTTGSVTFNIYDGVANPGINFGGNLADKKWHAIVGVRDFAADQLRTYRDGVLNSSVTDNTTGDVSTDKNIVVGGRSSNATEKFLGDLRDFFICNRVMTLAEIQAWVLNGTLPTDGSIIKRHLMNEGEGNISKDLVSGGSDMTLNGTYIWGPNGPMPTSFHNP